MEFLAVLGYIKTLGPSFMLALLSIEHMRMAGRFKEMKAEQEKTKKALSAILTAKQRKRLEDLELI